MVKNIQRRIRVISTVTLIPEVPMKIGINFLALVALQIASYTQ